MSEDTKDDKKKGKAGVGKTTIPHVHEAKGQAATVLAHAKHALAQIEAGHYSIENMRQTDMGNGRTAIYFERVETDLGVEAAPHGL